MIQQKKSSIKFFTGDIVNQFDDYQKGLMPGYELIFQTMEDVLNIHFPNDKSFEGWILDIGAGTGNESMRILKMSQLKDMKTFSIDSSVGMKNSYENKED